MIEILEVMMTQVDTIRITRSHVKKLQSAIDAALAYEGAIGGKRKLGITGEVGELLACHRLGLRLTVDPRSEGFDALDEDGLRVEIKTRRDESYEFPRNAGRVGRFSKHEFDYAILILLSRQYGIYEIWRADFDKLEPLVDSQKHRNPSLRSFYSVAERLFPPT